MIIVKVSLFPGTVRMFSGVVFLCLPEFFCVDELSQFGALYTGGGMARRNGHAVNVDDVYLALQASTAGLGS